MDINLNEIPPVVQLNIHDLINTNTSSGWRSFTQEQVQQVVKALQESNKDNWLKDYLFSIVSALFSAILGGVVAIFVSRHQENSALIKGRVNTVNALMIKALNIAGGLIQLKNNYWDYVGEKTATFRMFKIPVLKNNLQPIVYDTSNLGFVVGKAKERHCIRKWSDVGRIEAMFSNYNYLLERLTDINSKREAINKIVFKNFPDPNSKVKVEWLREQLGVIEFTKFMTEYEFLLSLPMTLSKSCISFLLSFQGKSKF